MKDNEKKKRRAKRDITPKKHTRAKRDVEIKKVKIPIEEPTEKKKPKKALLIAAGILLTLVIVLGVAFVLMSPTIDMGANPFENSDIMHPFGKKSAYSFETVYRYFREPNFGTIYTLEDFYANGNLKGSAGIERDKNSYNVLVVGKDRVGSNTDVIMVVNFNASTQEINVLQIPRDTYVEDPINVNQSKRINAIYAFAYMKNSRSMSHSDASHESVKYLEGVIEDTFGITIDNYFMIDLNGFVKIIDSIGGVEVDVPFDMYYNDEAQNLHIDLKKGRQTLNGNQSEQFVRFRNTYVLGDLGRVSAQKIYLSALVEKLLSPDWFTLDKLTSVATNLIKYSTTSVTLSDIVGYLKKIDFSTLSDDSITFYTAQGESFFAKSGASMYTLYMEENLEIINKAFNVYNLKVTQDHVTLSEQMRTEYTIVDTNGLTANEIEKDQPHIIVARPRPTVTPEESDGGDEEPTEGEIPEESPEGEATESGEMEGTEEEVTEDTVVEGEETEEGNVNEGEESPVEELPADEPLTETDENTDNEESKEGTEETEPDWDELFENGEIVAEEPTEDTYTEETERNETND